MGLGGQPPCRTCSRVSTSAWRGPASLCALKPRDFARKECISGEFPLQIGEDFEGLGSVLLSHVSNRQQNSGKGGEVAPMRGRGFQVGNATLLVCRQASQSEDPANGCGHASDDVLAKPGREQSVVTVVTDRQQVLRRCGRLLGVVQRAQILLVNESGIVGL